MHCIDAPVAAGAFSFVVPAKAGTQRLWDDDDTGFPPARE